MDIKVNATRGEDPTQLNSAAKETADTEIKDGKISISQESLVEDRYHRLRLIQWWNQQRLENAVVVVAGAGALGNEVLKNLALLGVGKMIVCDFDTIETSNLTRSVLFRQHDVGRRKVEVACERAMDINPDVKCVPVHGDLRFVLGYGLVRRADVVLGCLDSLEARYYLNHHSMKTQRAYIDAALDHLNGNVMTFIPHEGSCYECQMKSGEKKELKRRQSCLKLTREDIALGKVPTAPTISSIIAGMQAQIAVRHIHGRPVPLNRKIGLYGMTDVTFDIKMDPDPECMTHLYTDPLSDDRTLIEWPDAKASELTVKALLAKMAEHLAAGEGENATDVVWSLDDDRDIIVGLHDAESGRSKKILSLAGVLKEEDAIDEESGRVMVPELMSEFDSNSPQWILDKTLSEMGIPPLHIVYGRNIETGNDAYFELTGDLGLYFDN